MNGMNEGNDAAGREPEGIAESREMKTANRALETRAELADETGAPRQPEEDGEGLIESVESGPGGEEERREETSGAGPAKAGRWAASVGPSRSRVESMRRPGTKGAAKPEENGSGVRVIDAENDFPFARVTSIRIGSAHVVVHDDQQELAAVRAMRTVSDQINAKFDADAGGEEVEVVRK